MAVFFTDMKQKIRFFTFILTLFCVFVCGCRDLVEDEFDEFSRIPVVNSIFTNNHPLEINLSFTGKLNQTKFDFEENAEVLLYQNDIFAERLDYIGEGRYISKQTLKKQNKISCEIDINGYKTMFCTDTIPGQTIVTDITHIKVSGVNDEGVAYPAVKFTFESNPDEKQYYEVRIRLLRSYGDRYATLEKITDPIILNEGIPLAVFSNELITDAFYEMTLNYTTGSDDGGGMNLYPLIIEFRSISYNYYQFRKQYYLYEQGRIPEGISSVTAVFNMHSNIENGYGIFAGYASFQSDTIYP